jgi:hypothetical protein
MVVLMVVIVVVVVVVGSRDGSIYRCTFFLGAIVRGGFCCDCGKIPKTTKVRVALCKRCHRLTNDYNQ